MLNSASNGIQIPKLNCNHLKIREKCKIFLNVIIINNLKIYFSLRSIVVSIGASHASDLGSNPGVGIYYKNGKIGKYFNFINMKNPKEPVNIPAIISEI